MTEISKGASLITESSLSNSQQRVLQKIALWDQPKVGDIFSSEALYNWIRSLEEEMGSVKVVPKDQGALDFAQSFTELS